MRGARLAAGLALLLAAGCFGGAKKDDPPLPTKAEELNTTGLRRLEKGDVHGAEAVFKRALAEAELLDDIPAQASAWNNLGGVAMARSDPAQALAAHDRALELHGNGAAPSSRARTQLDRGAALLTLGRLDEATRAFNESRAIYTKLQQPAGAAKAEVGLASVALGRGDAQGAARTADAALKAVEKTPDQEATIAAALAVKAQALERTGDLPGAKAALVKALELDKGQKTPDAIASDLEALAEVSASMGDLAQARDYLERAARVEKQRGNAPAAEVDLARMMWLGAARSSNSDVIAAAEAIAELRTMPAKLAKGEAAKK